MIILITIDYSNQNEDYSTRCMPACQRTRTGWYRHRWIKGTQSRRISRCWPHQLLICRRRKPCQWGCWTFQRSIWGRFRQQSVGPAWWSPLHQKTDRFRHSFQNYVVNHYRQQSLNFCPPSPMDGETRRKVPPTWRSCFGTSKLNMIPHQSPTSCYNISLKSPQMLPTVSSRLPYSLGLLLRMCWLAFGPEIWKDRSLGPIILVS